MIGVDLIKIQRIESMVDKFGSKALDRFLSKKEIILAKNASTMAGFWAAKEAASKAIGTGIGKKCGFSDIKISKSKSGKPKLKYKKTVRKKFNIKKSHLSISHDSGFAIAFVMNENL